MKRIIGLPGETILIKEEGVFVNGQLLDETTYTEQQHLTLQKDNDINEIVLSENEYYGTDREFIKRVLQRFDTDKTIAFFCFSAYPFSVRYMSNLSFKCCTSFQFRLQ